MIKNVKHKKARSTDVLTWLFLCLMFATNLCHANFQTSPENPTACVAVETAHSNSNTRTNILALLELPATQFARRSGDQMMAETNTIGNSLSQVTRVGSLLLGEVRGGTAQHLDQDAFNSVIVTTLSDGTVPGRLSYRVFGAVRSLTGNVATPFRFNGYVSDGGDELSSPSRFYSLGTGRFTSMDPAKMDPMNPITGNPFVGMNANPMAIIDPTGRYGEAGHYYTTYLVAMRAGYGSRDAQKLAFYSQLFDEVDDLDAVGVEGESLVTRLLDFPLAAADDQIEGTYYDNKVDQHRDQVQIDWHNLADELGSDATKLTFQAVSQAGQDLAASGLLIHPLGDSLAHRERQGLMGMGGPPLKNARTYKNGFGHGWHGHDPDVIQYAPQIYLQYTATIALALADKRGLVGDQAKRFALKIAKELQVVADVPIKINRAVYSQSMFDKAIYALMPKGSISPPPIYTSYENHTRNAAELEEISIKILKEKLVALGADISYIPEVKGNSIISLILPVGAPKITVGNAVDAFNKATGNDLTIDETLIAMEKARLIIEQARQDKGKPKVIVEEK